LWLGFGFSARYVELNECSNIDPGPKRLELNDFKITTELNQSGLEYYSPGDVGVIINSDNGERIAGFYDTCQNNDAFNTHTSPFDGASYEADLPAGSNYPIEKPALFTPPAQNPAHDSLLWSTSTGFATALNAPTTPHAVPEGQPMNRTPTRQPDIRALHNHTRSMTLRPIPAVSPKRSAKRRGEFPCPVEGCSTSFSRAYDIRRHIADKHADHTLLCPVDGCTKRYARQDKRLDHLVKGHKLGPQAINLLIEAKLGG